MNPNADRDERVEQELQTEAARLFGAWWAVNHPWDWWTKDRNGESLPHRDRLLVEELVRRAFYSADALKLVAATRMRDACVAKVREVLNPYELEFRRKTNGATNMVDYMAMALQSLTLEGEQEKL